MMMNLDSEKHFEAFKPTAIGSVQRKVVEQKSQQEKLRRIRRG